MDTYDTMFSASYILNEQIARQVFETLPERGPVVAIMDRDGNCWPSNSDEFARLDLSETMLQDVQAKVDDGAEPVLTQVGQTRVAVAQLATEDTNCGYILIALSPEEPHCPVSEIDLLEALLSQITLVARLIEKNSLLVQARMRPYQEYGICGGSAN